MPEWLSNTCHQSRSKTASSLNNSAEEVSRKLRSTSNTAPGHDRVEYRHLKKIDPSCKLLSLIFAHCIRQGILEDISVTGLFGKDVPEESLGFVDGAGKYWRVVVDNFANRSLFRVPIEGLNTACLCRFVSLERSAGRRSPRWWSVLRLWDRLSRRLCPQCLG